MYTNPDFATILPDFTEVPTLRKVVLFGSRARGDFDDRSDIDLAIQTMSDDIRDWDAVCQYFEEHTNTLLSLDLTWLQHAATNLAKRIADEGVVLYERSDEPKPH